MIFRTITDDITGANKSIGLFGKTFNDFKGIINSFKQNGIVSTLLNTPLINIDTKAIDNYNNAVRSGMKSEKALAIARKTTNAETIALIESSNGLEVQTERVAAVQKASTIAAKTQAVALNAVSMAGSMLAFMAITKGIELAVKGIDSLIETQEEAAEALANAKSVSDSYKSSINDIISSQDELSSSADSIVDSYAKLSQGVNTNTNENIGLSNDDYEEFLNLNSQLADLFPSLIKGYDESGNAILGLGGNIDTVTGKIQALVEQQSRLSNKEILDNLEDYVNGDDNGGGQLEEIKRLEKKKKEAEDLVKVYDDVRKMFDTEEAGDVNKIAGISSGAIDPLMEKAGFAPEIATLDASGFWQFELNESEMIHLKETLNTYYGELISESQTAMDELTNANAEMSSEMMYWVQSLSQYTGSDEDMQNAMMNMVQGIDWSLVGADDYEGAKSAIQQLVLTPLKEMSGYPATQKQFSTALSSLFSLNLPDMPIGQAEEIVRNYIQQIMDMLNQFRPEDSQLSLDEVYSMFGMSDYQNPADKMLSGFHSIVGSNTSDMQKLSNYTKEFTLAQQQAWLSATLGAQNADDAIKKYEDSLKNSSSASTPASFSQAWDSIGTIGTEETKNAALEAKEKMLELARAGKLTEKELRNSSIADVFKDAGVSIEEATRKINHMVDASDQLSSMKSGIKSISDVLAQKKENWSNKETKEVGIDADTLAGFDADIKGLDSWKEFEKTLGNGKKDMDACQKAANKLATEWVNSNNFLSQLNDTNKDYYISTLKEMGVKNAEQIVTETLNQTISKENKEKINLAIATIDLSNGIQNSEVTALSNEISWLSTASAATRQYYLQKLLANKNALTTSKSTANLIQLAKQAGITGEAIAELTKLLEMQRAYEKMAENFRKGNIKSGEALNDFAEQIEEQKERVNRAANKKPDKETIIGKNSNGSGSDSPSTTTNNNNSTTPSPDKTETKSTQVIDWISRRLEVLQSAIDLTKAKFDNLFSLKSQKNNLDKQIKQTTKLLNAQSKAAEKYQKKADKIKISSDKKKDASLKKKVQNGDITGNMSELIATYGEKKANKIQKYQDYLDKAKNARKEIQLLRSDLKELKVQEDQLYVDRAEQHISTLDAEGELLQSAKSKNELERKKIKWVRQSYDYQIKIAKREKDSVKVAQLRAQKEKEILDIKKQILQNSLDENSAIRENAEARYENATTVTEKNQILDTEISSYQSDIAKNNSYYNGRKADIEKNGLGTQSVPSDIKKLINNSKVKESNQKKILNCIKSGKKIPDNLLNLKNVKNNPELLQKLLDYNTDITDKINTELSNLTQEQDTANQKTYTNIRNSQEQQLQNYADDHKAKYDLLQLQEDNAVSAEAKNTLESKSLQELEEQYAYELAIAKLKGDITEQERIQAEWQAKWTESYQKQYNNIKAEYDNVIKLNEAKIATTQAQISALEAQGKTISESMYRDLMSQTTENRKKLIEERNALSARMSGMVYGSDEYYAARQDLESLDQSILKCDEDLAGFQSSINNLKLSLFDRKQSFIDSEIDYLEYLTDMISHSDLTSKDAYGLTDEGFATISLYLREIDKYKEKALKMHGMTWKIRNMI